MYQLIYDPGREQSGALGDRRADTHNRTFRAPGRHPHPGAVGLPRDTGHGPRHRGSALQDADRPGVRLHVARNLLRALPYRLDRHQRHVSEIQKHESCDLALGCRPKESPTFG